jgi:hypothetical protein
MATYFDDQRVPIDYIKYCTCALKATTTASPITSSN